MNPDLKQKRLWKRLRHGLLESWFLCFLVRCLLRLLNAMPISLARRIGRMSGRLAYHLDRGHRAICHENLMIAFPEKSITERWSILKASYVHLGVCAVDFCRFIRISREDIRSQWIVPEEGAEYRLQKALSENRGVIAISAHIGFWELSGIGIPIFLGLPMTSVARKLASPRIDALVTGIRSRMGNTIIYQEGALRRFYRALKKKHAVGIIMDQHAGRESPWIPFFSREASTVDTCARLHLLTGAPLLSNLMIRRADGRYTWRCRPIEVSLPNGEDESLQIARVLTACNREFEDAIREHPEQWLWMHRRWRAKRSPHAPREVGYHKQH